MTAVVINHSSSINGSIYVPGDKSITHRAIIFAALAYGCSCLKNYLAGEDCLATLAAFNLLGIKHQYQNSDKQLLIYGKGSHGLQAPKQPIDCGNSGTTMRLLAGLLSAQDFDAVLVGDQSLQRRPMRRVVEPLRQFGADIRATDSGTAPLQIAAAKDITDLPTIKYQVPVASAQVKSCLLLTALYRSGISEISEPLATRDHTERMLQYLDYPLTATTADNGVKTIKLPGQHAIKPFETNIAGDFSSATFWIVAALLTPNSELIINDVGVNPTRIGALNLLRRMGASIEIDNQRNWGNEPVADLQITSSQLRAIDITVEDIPSCIDELPIIMVAASFATGVTKITGAAELRVKESDRIAVMAQNLVKFGIDITELADGAIIKGLDNSKLALSEPAIVNIDAGLDHRIAMAFTILAQITQQSVIINGFESVETSFPSFISKAASLGIKIQEYEGVI